MYTKLAEVLSHPISLLINKSLSTGIVPNSMKLAKVIPIYKSKDSKLFSNYRPISLLPTLSKLLEKVVHRRVYQFLKNKKKYCTRASMVLGQVTLQLMQPQNFCGILFRV